ncbi:MULTISPECIES: hypothetical protein [unclassified Streptomyces]|uniref:hypothetical protein n=1 Tax=unclassified Streptomyces TaxID=2593676 RepID=UPI0037F8FDA7
MEVVRELQAEGWQITGEDLAAITPYLTDHTMRFGSYATTELTVRLDAFDPHLYVDFDAEQECRPRREKLWAAGSGRLARSPGRVAGGVVQAGGESAARGVEGEQEQGFGGGEVGGVGDAADLAGGGDGDEVPAGGAAVEVGGVAPAAVAVDEASGRAQDAEGEAAAEQDHGGALSEGELGDGGQVRQQLALRGPQRGQAALAVVGEGDGRLRGRGEAVGQVKAELGVGGVAVGGAEDDQAVGCGVAVLAGVEVADGGGRKSLGETDTDVERRRTGRRGRRSPRTARTAGRWRGWSAVGRAEQMTSTREAAVMPKNRPVSSSGAVPTVMAGRRCPAGAIFVPRRRADGLYMPRRQWTSGLDQSV